MDPVKKLSISTTPVTGQVNPPSDILEKCKVLFENMIGENNIHELTQGQQFNGMEVVIFSHLTYELCMLNKAT